MTGAVWSAILATAGLLVFYLHDITVRSVADLNSTVQRQTRGSQSTPVQSVRHTFNVWPLAVSCARPATLVSYSLLQTLFR